jgi:secondary thiamine-phosphate synthase enzyme
MRIYSEQITLQKKKAREVVNITNQIKAAMAESAFRDGMSLVSSLHSNTAAIGNDEEPGLLGDLGTWLKQVPPPRDEYKHQGRFKSSSAVHSQRLPLHRQAVVPISEGRHDLGP